MSLWQDFMTNDKKVISKWAHYFPIYERHFASWQNKSMTFLEIGVSHGGSLQMWQRYFGPLARIVGIDIDPKCMEHEAPGISVRIGNQSDDAFLESVVSEFGVPDIVLDDGSHIMADMASTIQFFYPRMHKNAIYMVEDAHSSYWEEFGGGLHSPNSFINIAKDCVDRLHAVYSRGKVEVDVMTSETFGISFYDSIVCFEKGEIWWRECPSSGKEE